MFHLSFTRLQHFVVYNLVWWCHSSKGLRQFLIYLRLDHESLIIINIRKSNSPQDGACKGGDNAPVTTPDRKCNEEQANTEGATQK